MDFYGVFIILKVNYCVVIFEFKVIGGLFCVIDIYEG